MAKLNIKITRVDNLLNKFKKFGEKAEQIAASVTRITAEDITADAKRLAPRDNGDLAQSIGNSAITKLSYKIFALASYAAYQEFGTGGLVEIPPELKDLAADFKGKGIRKVNLKPQPFMWPALVINRQNYIFELKKQLKKLGNE